MGSFDEQMGCVELIITYTLCILVIGLFCYLCTYAIVHSDNAFLENLANLPKNT